ncbi:hypothetical protein LNP17_11855 [Klebsiella variicola subsp. variicola]|nr:hypothetical protein [Klebsiella variicola subsp. variicola]
MLAVQLLQEMIAEEPGRVKERLSFCDCSVISHEEKLVFTRAAFRG